MWTKKYLTNFSLNPIFCIKLDTKKLTYIIRIAGRAKKLIDENETKLKVCDT